MELVSRGYESKQIAPMLGVSPAAVDARIKAACRKLGETDRKEAARVYLAQQGAPQRPIYQPLEVAPLNENQPSPASPQDALRFQDAAFDDRALWDRKSSWHLPDFTPRDLGTAGRLLAIFALVILIMAALGESSDFAKSLGWLSPE